MPTRIALHAGMGAPGDSKEITRLPEIWDLLRKHAPRGRWVPIAELYSLIAREITLKAGDFLPAAPGSRQTRWQRNVRNVLQHHKTPTASGPADLLWDPPTQSYLIPLRRAEIPSLTADDFDAGYVPAGPRAAPIDELAPFEPENLIDAREVAVKAIVQRRGAPQFRARLLEVYESRCAVSATRGPPALEAAHIVPYRGPDTNHVANGLLLRADVHTLFDLGLVAVEPFSLRVDVAQELRDTDYGVLGGAPLHLPVNGRFHPSQRSLAHHYARSRVA